MPFDVRCPECSAKLRLDEEPEPGTAIECPRCGSQFRAPRKGAASAEKPKPRAEKPRKQKSAGGGKKKKHKLRKLTAKKKKTNPVFLLAAIGFGFLGLILVGIAMVWFLNRAGRVQEMLTYVPATNTWVRGINVAQLSKYPGYKGELDKFYTPPIQEAVKEFARVAGREGEESFLDYLVVTRGETAGGPTATMYILRFRYAVPSGAGAELTDAREESAGGESFYRVGGRGAGLLRNAVCYLAPDGKIAVIKPSAGGSDAGWVSALIALHDEKTQTMGHEMNATTKTTVRGAIWLLVNRKGWLAAQSETTLKDLAVLQKATAASTTFGLWTTPGGSGVRFGAAMEMPDEETAAALPDAMREGPLGKGDESEPPNSMKQFQLFSQAKMRSELLQSLSYKSKGECAYVIFTLTGENARSGMSFFNSPELGLGGGGTRVGS